MSGKRRRKDPLTDSDSDLNLDDSPDLDMDSAPSAADPGPSVTSDPGSDPRSSLTTAPGTGPRSSLASNPGTDPRPNQTTAGSPVADSEPYLEPTGSYVVIKPTDDNVSFRKVNVFWPTKYLSMICGTGNLDIETPANGTLIVKTQSRAQTKALLKCTRFCEKDVSVFLHSSRNTTKGTIFAPELRYMSEEELMAGLRPEGVSHVRRLTTFRDGQRRDTSLLVVTFNTTTLPDTLLAGYIRYEVRVFIPNPLRCFNCQRFGHGSKFCKQSARCFRCGDAPHEGTPCSSPTKCLSCDASDHATNSNQCPVWKKEKEICSVKATTGVSYPQARRTVEEKTAKQPAKTYALATQKQTVATSTQTDDLPQLPPLKCLSPVPLQSSESVTSDAPSQTTTLPDIERSSRPSNDRSTSNTPDTHSSARTRLGPDRAPSTSRRSIQPSPSSQPPSRSSSETRPTPCPGRQSRPAVRIALGHARGRSTGRSRSPLPSKQNTL